MKDEEKECRVVMEKRFFILILKFLLVFCSNRNLVSGICRRSRGICREGMSVCCSYDWAVFLCLPPALSPQESVTHVVGFADFVFCSGLSGCVWMDG